MEQRDFNFHTITTTKIVIAISIYSLYKMTIVGFNRYPALSIVSVNADSTSVDVKFFN